MANNIYIIALEPIESRYTCEWYSQLPKLFKDKISKKGERKYWVRNIDGYGNNYIDSAATPGAFLNFTNTNIWKNNQLNKIATLFVSGEINKGDVFVIADAWNPGVIQLKYMSELLNIPIEIHSIWHAGSYDKNDFLGRAIKDKAWSYNFERSVLYASDYNYFATGYHCKLIMSELEVDAATIIRAGFPFDYLPKILSKYKDIPKENIILFPHRLAPEKQPNIFLDLATELPEYKFILCQESDLTKHEYRTLVAKSKIIFSANLQETLGISCYEGALLNSIPLVPDRLSYTEMYPDLFKYDAQLTDSWDSYINNKELLKERIGYMINNYYTYIEPLKELQDRLTAIYFTSNKLIGNIIGYD